MIRTAATTALVLIAGALGGVPASGNAATPEQRGFNIPDQGGHPAKKKESTPSPPSTPSDDESAERHTSAPQPASPVVAPAPVAPRPVAASRPALPETGFDAVPLTVLGALALFAGLCFRYAIKLDEQLDRARSSSS